MRRLTIWAAAALCAFLAGCSPQEKAEKTEKIRIGLSMDSLRVERWKRDRDLFMARVEALGGETLVQSADGSPDRQNSQAENLLAQDIDALVVIPRDGEAAAAIVEAAKKANVPVLAYDRIIRNCDLDLYISFDNERVGYMQAEYLTRVAPEGNYFLLGGSPSDNNAKLLRAGQERALKPLLDSGAIRVVGDQWTDNWDPDAALGHVENALTAQRNMIDAIVASNDGTAGGAVEALRAQGLAGKTAVSGQDADLAACQRIAAGLQTMTVYKPLKPLAERAAELAVALAKGGKPETSQTTPNGKIDVPSVLLDPVQVDKNNLYDVVVKDGFHSIEDVYQDVPKDEWPGEPKP